MSFYFTIFAMLSISMMCTNRNRTNQRLVFKLWIVFFATLVAIRYNIGADYQSYVNIFRSLNIHTIFNSTDAIEPGYALLNILLKSIGASHHILFFCTSLMTTWLFYNVSKKVLPQYCLTSLLMFYSFYFLQFELNLIRHGIMVMWVWLGFTYIPSRNLKQFVYCVCIGGMFHMIAFTLLPMYWLLNHDFKNKTIYISLISTYILITLYLSPIQLLQRIVPADSSYGMALNYYANNYYINNESSIGFSLGFFVYMFVLIVFINIQQVRTHKYYTLLKNALFFALILYMLFMEVGVFVERYVSLFYISLMFIVPLLIRDSFRNKYTKLVVYIVFILYCALLLRNNLTVSVDETGQSYYIPFKTIFN